MLTLKSLFELTGLTLLAVVATILFLDLCRLCRHSTFILHNEPSPKAARPRWLTAGIVTAVALGFLVGAFSRL